LSSQAVTGQVLVQSAWQVILPNHPSLLRGGPGPGQSTPSQASSNLSQSTAPSSMPLAPAASAPVEVADAVEAVELASSPTRPAIDDQSTPVQPAPIQA